MPSIAVIGRGFVGTAQIEVLSAHADVFSWDIVDGEPYPRDRLQNADLAIVCVPTPRGGDGRCDTRMVEEALRTLPTRRVLLRSTVPPGFSDRWARATGTILCFAPEYIGETQPPLHAWGSDAGSVPFFILGGAPQHRREILSVLGPIIGDERTVLECEAAEAETIKYMENSFLALKLAFVNEFYDYCVAQNLDWETVRKGWILDPRIGSSHTTVFPERRGFSGSCLPKDLDAIIASFQEMGMGAELLSEVRSANLRHRRLNAHEATRGSTTSLSSVS
jgi:UDPglucose 6-dehydrogenase